MMASMHGMTDVVRMLLEKGADCMMTDGHKNLQALQGAADGCAALLARHMLKHHKHELLLHKIRSGDELAVEMLLNAGADASYKDKDGRDALAHAEDYECRILLKQHIAEQSLHGAAAAGATAARAAAATAAARPNGASRSSLRSARAAESSPGRMRASG